MGCTSSIPNISTTKANSGADSKHSEQGNNSTETEDTPKDIGMDAKTDNVTNVANVLPKTCDNLVVLTELDRSNKYLFNVPQLDQENGLKSHGQEIINDKICVNDKEDVINNSIEDNLSTLVERVAESYIADRGIENSNGVSGLMDDKDDGGVNKTNKSTEQLTDVVQSIESKSYTCGKESPAGFVSPSQSQGSRATRWEALADVAAELPPSLAVDPLTGQIFALSK